MQELFFRVGNDVAPVAHHVYLISLDIDQSDVYRVHLWMLYICAVSYRMHTGL